MKVLVTGAAGFIGFHTALALLNRGDFVVGVDNLNDYYSVDLKKARLERLQGSEHFRFVLGDLADQRAITKLFSEEQFEYVVHLAAQAGVRYSLSNPAAYVHSNVSGFLSVLEGCRHQRVRHCVFASSSSVYGANTTLPYSTDQNVDHPLSLYAATKKANELMAHSYAHLYQLPMTGLRFFTVYGPWGRPDMSPFIFTERILRNEPINVFNNGKHARDFTYIDDVVDAVVKVLDKIPVPDPQWNAAKPRPQLSIAPYRLFNVGNSKPVELLTLISLIEQATGKTAKINLLPMQPGDVATTAADIGALVSAVGPRPQTPLEDGLNMFVKWYRKFYHI